MRNILKWKKFNESNINDDYRDSWNVTIVEYGKYGNVGKKSKIRKVMRLGDSVEQISKGSFTRFIHPIYDSQVTPVDGIYTLMKVPLEDINVVYDGIAKRKFFDFDDQDGWQTNHLNDMKRDFFETPPVTLEEKDGKYYSVDGHHRATVALELGHKNILAFVTSVDEVSPDVIH